jgi:quinoprotein glucose dehydrogenase
MLAVLVATLVGIAGSSPSHSRPDHLEPAQKYGATSCGFCHVLPSGGQGHNERGSWLISERDRKGVAEIDVEWLSARDPLVESAERTTEPPSEVLAVLPEIEEVTTDRERPFDYTTRHGDWPAYGGDLGSRKYAGLGQITPENLDQLQVAWIWNAEDKVGPWGRFVRRKAPDGFKATPLMVGGRLYVRSRFSEVVALDPIRGEELWTYDPGTREGKLPPQYGFATRGLAYHRDAKGDRVMLLTSDGWLIAISPETGKPFPDFGDKGRVDLTQGLRRPLRRNATAWSGAPTTCGDTVVIGNQASDASHREGGANEGASWQENLPLGDVRGFDVHTGEQKWVFRTVPQADEVGNETWGNDSWKWMGNTNVWSMMSCDPELGHVYLPITAPSHQFYGGARPGDNLFATSLVAVDAETGKRVWHFQTVHHDIWDYDLPAAPVVVDLVVAGQPRKAVAQVGKTGFLYVLDRVTGQPIWPIEEREVPASTLVGERAARTQPFPTWPPPFEMQGATVDDLIDFTPELRREALEVVKGHRLGPIFLPPSLEGSVTVPGIAGGASWGGAAFDPETRMLYVASMRLPFLLKAERVKAGYEYRVQESLLHVDYLPIVKPPWSSITAYKLDTGEIAWSVPNGAGLHDHPRLKGLELPDLGALGEAPGLLVTKHLIFFGHSEESGRGGLRPTELRALDKRTGELQWQHRIDGEHMWAPPMTYMAGGRQFVVVATGSTTEPARLTAFRLP